MLAGCASACQRGPVRLASADARVSIELSPFVLRVQDAQGRDVLVTLPGDGPSPYGAPATTLDRPHYLSQILSGWDGYRAIEAPWTRAGIATLRAQTTTTASLDSGSIRLDVSINGPRVRLQARDLSGLNNKTSLSFSLGASEHFFGLGERYASFDHRGLSLYSYAEEAGLSAGEGIPPSDVNPYPNGRSMTYFPVPFFYSSGGYAVFIENTERDELHFGDERPDAWRMAVNAASFKTTIYVHAQPLDSLRDFTEDTGRPPVPAPWIFGPRRTVGLGQQALGQDEWRLLRARGVPTTGLDENTHFLPQRSEAGREDALRAWVETLHANGFKALAYATPYVSLSAEASKSDLAYGSAHGYFVLGQDGKPAPVFFSSGMPQSLATIDLTNPGAVAWFETLLSRMVALGYDGWMHDFGEYLPRDVVLFDGRSGAEVHNEFPFLSARAARDLLEREKPGDNLFFARSGWTGTGSVAAAVWSGDPEANLDDAQGLPAQLRAGLGLSMSGAPYWGSDISGYKCLTPGPHDKEMYLRWAAVGAVSPLMMDDTACAAVLTAETKWSLWSDDETVRAYSRLASLHTRLQPYFLTLAAEAHASGRPLMIQPFLLYPGRPETYSLDDAFFLGPALYAAPVVRRAATARTVWLPPGRYIELNQLSVHPGDANATVPAPLGTLPLFLVAGQLLPLLDESVQTLAPATEPSVVTAASVSDRLDVRVALAPGQSAQLTLVDGTQLFATRGADSGNPQGLAQAASIADCARCFLEAHEGEVDRLRANGELAVTSRVVIRDVQLTAQAGPARRVRWDVLRIQ